MLDPMQQTSVAPSTPTSPSFAGLLAALTSPVAKTAWNNDDLADDVATLSYEHALRTHARYTSSAHGDLGFTQSDNSGAGKGAEAHRDDLAVPRQTASSWPEQECCEDVEPKSAHDISTMLERNKKSASITIRLSKAECDQLRQRAAHAGLTVSAYLRSCTFEAEALRAQVKDVLAEMRKAAPAEKPGSPAVAHRSWFGWLRRLLPLRHSNQRAMQA
jgi:predicted DNA binding CopG/RHH family protein